LGGRALTEVIRHRRRRPFIGLPRGNRVEGSWGLVQSSLDAFFSRFRSSRANCSLVGFFDAFGLC